MGHMPYRFKIVLFLLRMTSTSLDWTDWVSTTRYFSIRISNILDQAILNLAMVFTVSKSVCKQIWLLTLKATGQNFKYGESRDPKLKVIKNPLISPTLPIGIRFSILAYQPRALWPKKVFYRALRLLTSPTNISKCSTSRAG